MKPWTLPLTLALLVPAAAWADCPSLLRSASREASTGLGLSSGTVRELIASCGPEGPATLVAALVSEGSCDDAAQLGRSLGDRPGMPGALAAADACLGAQLQASLEDLEWSANRAPTARPAEEVDEAEPARDLDATAGPKGAGYGSYGGGALGAESGGAAGRSRSGADSRWGDEAASGPAPSRPAQERAQTRSAPRAAKRGAYASTGSGRLVDSPVGERMALADSSVRPDTTVAWSQLSFGIWFDVDSAALRPEALGTVASLARHLGPMDRGMVLEIVGHTDSTGAWSYNRQLSHDRARSVEAALRIAGIGADKLVIRGAGEDEPVASNGSYWGRSQNRRVEFRFWRPVASRAVTR